MCIFSNAVEHVSGTQIFARLLPGGRQALVYSMRFSAASELAMLLPLPVPPGAADGAVEFVDLSGYPTLFDDLKLAFPAYAAAGFAPQARGGKRELEATLVVYDVGAFEASFVPGLADFARLDPRFRLPSEVWQALPQYADYGFAVFKLKPIERRGLLGGFVGRGEPQGVHPMAFSFPQRAPRSVFFPTLHIHAGKVEPLASFDHSLTAQFPPELAELVDWQTSAGPLGAYVDAGRCKQLVDANAGAHRLGIHGQLPNADVVIELPRGLDLAQLRFATEHFELGLRLAAAFNPNHAAHRPRWAQNAHRMGELRPRLIDAFRGYVEANGARLGLCRITAELPRYFMNGNLLYSGVDWLHGQPAECGGPGVVRFSPWSDTLEPQSLSLGFSRVPERLELGQVVQELNAVLLRAVP